MPRFTISTLAFAASMLLAGTAAAHIQMQYPTPRYPDQKAGPCGKGAGDAPTANINTFQGGETIIVRWTETIQHPGHFRISFDDEGQDDFGDPAGYDDFYSNPAVLVDEIADKVENQAMYEQEITFPEMSCDSCTLQLIQVMTDKPPYEMGTNDLYYQCADIVLMGAAETTGDDTTGPDTTAGTTGLDTTGSDTTGSDVTTDATTTTGGTTEDVTTATPTTAPDPTTGSVTGDDTTGAPGSTGDSAGNNGSDDDGGCGCDSGGGGATGLAALVLLAARRRRRG
ncbi:SCE4755 family polysaccharide monooxygenase-like protein [Nannocystis sp. SCPEA4]|uniref:SCE4755 family polysaccharide monooxygenase-like protein n=1 Tax=Nannocystis sp. SCPEA4 TaxID=2996787 RepID=UPI00226EEF43|nr:SCE4755 family polysaccharide monooxygenase-like protein [Nannocystis sp. SCPEA4]MCY1057425.1 lytic polysaccharide monooxygenase [Nannocystis sp. SCPEA4]